MTCLGPIPAHLAAYDWYAPHQAWLRDQGLPHHDPGDAQPERANLRGAKLMGANLRGADLERAILRGANLAGANLARANLARANLAGANLRLANLRGAKLMGANLRGADLERAILRGANLAGANLERATLPDGRTLSEWRADPLAGLCDTPEATSRAIAAWGNHSWSNCPMHEAHGWSSIWDVEADKRDLVATFVALFDGRHLPSPRTQEGGGPHGAKARRLMS